MSACAYYLLLSTISFGIIFTHFTELIPERLSITYVNKKYVEYANLTITRYGRKSGYFVNLEGIIKHEWGNNVSLHIVFYELLHNEYKRSFIEMKFKGCEILRDPYIGGLLRERGAVCPTPRGKNTREASLEELRRHIHKYYCPLKRQFIVLFPEGGFLHKRRAVSQRFAEKNNLPKLEYVTLPRVGAMKVIMEELGPNKDEGASSSKDIYKNDNNFNQNSVNKSPDSKAPDCLEWVLDVTIAYPDRIPLHLQDVVCGVRPPCTTHLHYRLYPISEDVDLLMHIVLCMTDARHAGKRVGESTLSKVPQDTEGMTQWLYERFIEKDKMLEEYYRTGKFPTKGSTPYVPRQVRQDNLQYLIVHLFFIASSLIQYKLLCTLSNYFW